MSTHLSYCALPVLLLIINLGTYLVLLGYNAQREILNSVFTMMLGPGGSLASIETPRGIPLVFQWPMYGFIVFVASLAALCLWAVLRVAPKNV